MQEEKIIMRALEPEDAEKIYEWENDSEQWNNGVNTRFFSLVGIKEYIFNQQNDDIFSSCQTRNIIELQNDTKKEIIGCVDLYDIDAKNSKAGIGIYIQKEKRGQGYAKKSISLLEQYASNTLCLYQLYAFVSENNVVSQSLFASLGYNKTVELKDWVRIGKKFENVIVYQKIL
ncbi:MAG: GNAT family N-acetyltransferase [Bacteroidales bacterium]|nr:GNAT family N-acetyltransferase [Bacteroidales bacterium]